MSDKSRAQQKRPRQKGTSKGQQTGPTGARHCLQSLVFFLAGSFELVSQTELISVIEKHGGNITSTLSNGTDFAVVGSGKLATKTCEIIDRFQIKRINQDQLFALIRRLPSGGTLQDEERAVKARSIIGSSDALITEDDDDVEDIEDDEDDQPALFSKMNANKRKLGSTLVSAAPQRKLFKHDPAVYTQQHDTRAWTERYRPRSVDELGVNKTKTKDVEDSLLSAFGTAHSPKALVLKGPPGSGKTTVVELLAERLDIELKYWTNPPGNSAGSSEYTSFATHFDDFVGTAGKFGTLETSADSSNDIIKSTRGKGRQLLVIEEFPSLSSDTSLRAFRSIVAGYISSISHRQPVTPIIFIMSESVVSNSSNSSDKFTAHRVLGPDIINLPSLRTIEFNEVAPTFLTKALKLVSDRRAKDTRKPAFASLKVIKKLATLKDIRQAIATLEFLETQVRQPAVTLVGSKGSTKSATDMAKEAERIMLDMIEERHGNLGLFHAVGKVIYNKRVEQTGQEKPASEVDVEALYSTTGTDTSTFISALHENYTLSCYCPTNNKEDDLDALNSCTESLCDADLLSAWSASTSRSRSGNATAGEELRQDEIAFDVSVRGLLYALPYPVKRRAPTFTGSLAGHRYDPHRMYYPKDIKLWRQREEVSSILDSLSFRALNGTLDADLSKILPTSSLSSLDLASIGSGSTSSSSAKLELLLDRLPYVSKLISSKTSASGIQRDIERVTRFRGKGIFATDDDSDEELDADEKLKNNPFSVNPRKIKHQDELGVQSLVLSDDDIEDDDDDEVELAGSLPSSTMSSATPFRKSSTVSILPQHVRSTR